MTHNNKQNLIRVEILSLQDLIKPVRLKKNFAVILMTPLLDTLAPQQRHIVVSVKLSHYDDTTR